MVRYVIPIIAFIIGLLITRTVSLTQAVTEIIVPLDDLDFYVIPSCSSDSLVSVIHAVEILFLVAASVVAFNVRKTPSAFNESRVLGRSKASQGFFVL